MTADPPPRRRLPALDWLRGIGVLIMIEGHALDAWTRMADRDSDGYRYAIMLAGLGAPIFLFLAGVAIPLAAASRLRKGATTGAAFRAVFRHGAWIFALAFAFRLQALLISGGTFPRSLLKVDILNVMGVSMMAGAVLWRLGRGHWSRALCFAVPTVVIAMMTPIVRSAASLSALPDPLEWYLRPAANATTFTLFPWAAFLTAGGAVGVCVDAAGEPGRRQLLAVALAASGVAIGGAGYLAAYLPPLYENTTFWSGSPTFFFVRLGIVVASVPAAMVITRFWPAPALQEFGRASLFVYWIHVEMAYGVISLPLHRSLSFPVALLALVLFAGMLYALVRLKARFAGPGRPPEVRVPGARSPARSPAGP